MGHLTIRADTTEEAIRLGNLALNPIRTQAGLPALTA
jgi:hypothetical protein